MHGTELYVEEIERLRGELAKAQEIITSCVKEVSEWARKCGQTEARVKELEAVDQRNAELIEERDQYKLALSETKDGLAECVHEDPKAFNRGYVKGMEEVAGIAARILSETKPGETFRDGKRHGLAYVEDEARARIAEIKRAESKEEKR